MKLIFKMLTFLILTVMLLVVVGILWTDGPIPKIYSGFSEYTNYIMWIFAILGAIALFFDFKNIRRATLIVFIVSLLTFFIYFILSADSLGDKIVAAGSTTVDFLKNGPFLIVSTFIKVPDLLLLSTDGFSMVTWIVLLLLLFYSISSFILAIMTRVTNSLSGVIKKIYTSCISIIWVINVILLLQVLLGLNILSDSFLDMVINVYLCSTILMFFAGVGFFTANYGFDSVIKDISMSAADSIIEKNVKELYTHPAINALNEQDRKAEAAAQGAQLTFVNNPVPTIIEDNPLPVVTEQVLKSDTSNVQQQAATNQETLVPVNIPISEKQFISPVNAQVSQSVAAPENNTVPVTTEEVLKNDASNVQNSVQ